MSEIQVMFAGLPGSGKTSYLAILYQAIATGKAGDFELRAYGEDDRVFINEVSARLLAAEPAIHTEADDKQEVSLSLTAHGQAIRLRVPDLGGEVWDHALAERRWVRELDDRLRGAVGYLVFVHAVDVERGTTLAQKRKAEELFAVDEDDGEGEGDEHGPDVPTDGPADGPRSDVMTEGDHEGESDDPPTGQRVRQTQVALVDLIHLLEARRSADPVRISIVVSAWDRIRKDITPDQWLHTNCPLLEQFIRHNDATLDVRVWGISAQGGRFDIETSKDRLLTQDAVDRATCKDGLGVPHTIDGPLAWALSLD